MAASVRPLRVKLKVPPELCLAFYVKEELSLDISTTFKLFDTCVMPIALYGSEVWGYENCTVIEKMHLKFCKLLLSLKRSTCSAMVYGETGRYPIHCYIQQKIINFWHTVATSQSAKLSNYVYKTMLWCDQERQPWLNYVKNLLCGSGLNFVWLSQGTDINRTWLKNKIHNYANYTFIQSWHGDVLVTKMFKLQIFQNCFRSREVSGHTAGRSPYSIL